MWVIWWQTATAFLYSVEMALEALLPPTRPNYQEFHHNSYIMWGENHTQILHGLIHVTWDIHPCPSTPNHGQPPSWEVCCFHFNIKDSNRWPPKGCFWICNGCSSERKTSRTCSFHKDCDVGLCLSVLQVVSYKTLLLSISQSEKWLTAMESSDAQLL